MHSNVVWTSDVRMKVKAIVDIERLCLCLQCRLPAISLSLIGCLTNVALTRVAHSAVVKRRRRLKYSTLQLGYLWMFSSVTYATLRVSIVRALPQWMKSGARCKTLIYCAADFSGCLLICFEFGFLFFICLSLGVYR